MEACPPSRLYRFRKFVRRNRVAFVSTVLVAFRSSPAPAVATWQSIRATREGRGATRESQRVAQERNRAESARAEAEGLASLGLEVLDEVYLGVLGDRLARQPQVSSDQRQLLQAGLDYYQQFVQRTGPGSDRTLVIANAHRQIGLILGRLGDRQGESHAIIRRSLCTSNWRSESPNDARATSAWPRVGITYGERGGTGPQPRSRHGGYTGDPRFCEKLYT